MSDGKKTTEKRWESFEQWKDDVFPDTSSEIGDNFNNLNMLVEKIASRSLAEARREMRAP